MADSPEKKKESTNPNLPQHTYRYLRRLTKTGLHGKTVGAVTRTLIQDQIKLLIAAGALRWEFSDEIDEGDEGSD
jgi:hypothetical protein